MKLYETGEVIQHDEKMQQKRDIAQRHIPFLICIGDAILSVVKFSKY
jgi:hypothetical protein